MKIYTRMSELCTELGLTSATVRYWVRCLQLHPNKRRGILLFSRGQVERIRLVKELIYEVGLTIEAARHVTSIEVKQWPNGKQYTIQLNFPERTS